MRKWLWFMIVLYGMPLAAQSTSATAGYCTLGGSQAVLSGMKSTNTLQGIIPGCTVTVYSHGTQTKATIYADSSNTPLSNPFTANVASSSNSGAWIFWAADFACYDVVGSGGVAPNTYPAPVTLTEVCPGGAAGGGVDLSSPPPIGNVKPNTGQFTILNSVIDAATYSGSDIGAKVNAAIAANSCGTSTPCQLVIPPGLYSFSTAITLPQNTSLDCGLNSGWSSVQASGATTTSLTYTGSGDAITLSGLQATLKNCALTVGNTATSGVTITAGQTMVERGYLIGGGTSTKLVNINCGSSGCEKPELDFVDFYGYTGKALYCANANDATLTNLTGYSANAQITSVAVTVDSQCNGLKATRISFGGSGLHQIVLSDTLSTGAPTWAVFNLAEADCARGGAGVLFDSTLDGQLLNARFVNSWAAGSGQDCANPTSAPVTIGAAGFDIAGGTAITIEASEIRANVGDGVLIHSASAQNIKILNSNIWGNNFKYRTFGGDNGDYNGIRISTIANGLIISGNYFGNAPGNLDGHQHYGIKSTQSNPLNTVIYGNNFNDNTIAPYVYVAGQQFPIIYGSATPNSGTAPDNVIVGQISAYSFAAPINRPFMIPSYASADNFLMGFGVNGNFNGTNWLFPSDGGNNGGSMFLGVEDGSGAFYSVPTNGTPASDQTVTPTNLNSNNKILTWNTLGQISIPKFGSLTSSTSNPASACTICFAKTDVLSWRNNANSGNLNLGINSSDQLTYNGTVLIMPLSGVTGSIGGSALTAGTCSSGTATVTGATVGHPVSVSASDGTLPNGLIILSAAVTSSNTVTVQICATGSVTPTAKAYIVGTQ